MTWGATSGGAGGDDACAGGPEIVVPDVVGALRGLRTWRMDKQGNIHGVTYPERWEPGENEARCLVFYKEHFVAGKAVYKVQPTPSVLGTPPYTFDPRGRLVPLEGYGVGLGCPGVARGNHGCGFYARHGGGGTTSTGYNGQVHGVVEMYGQVELGPEGMRAQKARVVALVRPTINREVNLALTMRDRALSAMMRLCRMPWWARYSPSARVRAAYANRDELLQKMLAALEETERVVEGFQQDVETFDKVTALRFGVPVYLTVHDMLVDFPVPDLTYMVEVEGQPVTPEEN